ncbi:ATP-binding protein [Jatrophihabitans telluris]|uniref:histidine kinase n=1 Tax=Jatrophihabitans telluris TaxID=2038343 RepID=A0ABY4QZ71_9ACTN|nr:ATP-binding protein [Jatrophihabitans telluris]UQX88633.1 ATP-binding protein [Jatrophihabitans telluris]
MAPDPIGWWRRRSLRARITVVATSLFTITLVLAGFALLFTVGKSLLNTLDASAERTGREVAVLVQQNKLPQQLIAGSGGVSLVQVVDGQNRVVAFSAAADGAKSILRDNELTKARLGNPINVDGARANSDQPIRVVGVRADLPGGQRTVLVATDLGRVLESSRLLQRYLLFLTPLAVIMMAGLTWWIVGLTLRPVAALQRGAAQLSATGLSRSRLPVPTAEDEIYSLATTLNDMLDRLDVANSKQRRFVGDAAHELRSPIASLRLQLEVAGRLGESQELRELTSDALIDVERLSNLIDDLLALARSDERGAMTHRAPVRLDELTRVIVAGYADARVPVTLGELAPVTVIGDRDGLYRVMVNLIDNAVRYARTSVQLSLAPGTGADSGWAQWCIADDGPGVPANKRERVFDRFYRLDTARSRAEGGTGLGLAIVREIITAHAGTITLHDNDPGLLVRITLPV